MQVPLQIVVVSGKGGTGKTTLSSSLVYLFGAQKFPIVGIDADVEAPDLILALGGGKLINVEEIYESSIATIDYMRCTKCMECINACQFRAIRNLKGYPDIIYELCEGCGTCAIVCPEKVISFKRIMTGRIEVYQTRYGYIVTGRLELGRRNSGLLVDIVRNKARTILGNPDNQVLIIDAAPGIGCPVISSIVGTDYAIIVSEPTESSLNSARRVFELIKHFNIPTGLVINKYDINESFVKIIENWVGNNGIDLLGKIPFDRAVPESYASMIPLLEFARNSSAGQAVLRIYEVLLEKLKALGKLSKGGM